MTSVHEVMSAVPVTVAPSTSLTDLLTLFDRHDYNAFPVVGQGGELVGIVSKLDVLRRFVAGAGKPGNLEEGVSAADLIQQEVVSVPAEDSLADAGGLMVGANLRSVPVTHGRDAQSRRAGLTASPEPSR